MRRILQLLLLLFFPITLLAQTQTVVTGVIGGATFGYVEFSLQPQSTNVLFFVSGTQIIAPQTFRCSLDTGGNIIATAGGSCLVWGNNVISPANTTYTLTLAPNNVRTNTISNLCINGTTWSLSLPIFCPTVSLVPQFFAITTPPFNANLTPGGNKLFNIGGPNTYYAAGYIDTLFTNNLGMFPATITVGSMTVNSTLNNMSLCNQAGGLTASAKICDNVTIADYILFKDVDNLYKVQRTSDGALLNSATDAALTLNAFFAATNFVNASGQKLQCHSVGIGSGGGAAAAFFLSTTVLVAPTQNFTMDCPYQIWQETSNAAIPMFQIDSFIDSTFNLGILSEAAGALAGASEVLIRPLNNGPDGVTTATVGEVNVDAVVGAADGIILDGTGSGAINNIKATIRECNLSGGASTKRCFWLKGGTQSVVNSTLSLFYENTASTALRIDNNTLINSNVIYLTSLNMNLSIDDQQPTQLNSYIKTLSTNPPTSPSFTWGGTIVHGSSVGISIGTTKASDAFEIWGTAGTTANRMRLTRSDSTVASGIIEIAGSDEVTKWSFGANQLIGDAFEINRTGSTNFFNISSIGTTTFSPNGNTNPLTIFNNSGNTAVVVNGTGTDFSSGILVSEGTFAIAGGVTPSHDAKILALNASGGDGRNQIVATHSGGGITQPLEIWTDSTQTATFGTTGVGAPYTGINGIPSVAAVSTNGAAATTLIMNATGGDGKSQIVATHIGGGTTQPLEVFSDSTLISTHTVVSGTPQFLVGANSTDFSPGNIPFIVVSADPVIASASAITNATILDMTAVGGDGNAQIVTTHSGGAGVTKPLEIWSDSTKLLTLQPSQGLTVGLATGTGTTLNGNGTVFLAGLTTASGAPAAVCLQAGTKEMQVNTGVATCTVSTLDLKDWIEDITCNDALRIIKTMRPAVFRVKDGSDGPRFGFAAQWTEPVDSKLVDYDDKGKLRSVDYERYTAVLTKALQCWMEVK